MISHLTVDVRVSEVRLKLREFVQAVAPCRSIDLTIQHHHDQVVVLADLLPLAASLRGLTCKGNCEWRQVLGSLRGASALSSMSLLTSLNLKNENLTSEEPWGLLASLTSLQQLTLKVAACGDPSPLSALTGLSSLHLKSIWGAGNRNAFSFSSLHPLSTLQQLEVLHLGGQACAATSLQGLAGLSNLKELSLKSADLRRKHWDGYREAAIPVEDAFGLVSLAGIEGCSSLESLSLTDGPIPSLQPLRGLSNLKGLNLVCAKMTSLEGLDMRSLRSLHLENCPSLIQLSGLEHFSTLEYLEMMICHGVTSFQPLSQLGEGLKTLSVFACVGMQEKVLELPHVSLSADLDFNICKINEVVLAGGVRRAVKKR
jgi:Leucine-rich repeat (LRR) protein